MMMMMHNNRYSGRMVFLKVDCGGTINLDVKAFAKIAAFPTFHVCVRD